MSHVLCMYIFAFAIFASLEHFIFSGFWKNMSLISALLFWNSHNNRIFYHTYHFFYIWDLFDSSKVYSAPSYEILQSQGKASFLCERG